MSTRFAKTVFQVLIGVCDSSMCDSRKYFTIQTTVVDCDAIRLAAFAEALIIHV